MATRIIADTTDNYMQRTFLRFFVANANNGTERLTLDPYGHVGISTATPSNSLTIAADSAQSIIELKRTNTNTTGSFGAISWTAMDGHSVANMYALGDGDNEGAHILFRTTSAAAANDPCNAATVERVRITSDGKIAFNHDTGASTIADVDIRSNNGVHIRGQDGNVNNANIYLGGSRTNQRKNAIIHDPVGGYCRGDLHFCLDNNADLSDVDINDSQMVMKAAGHILMGTTTQNNSARLQVSSSNQVVATFEGTGVSDPQIYLGDDMSSPTDNCIILGYDKADNRGYLTVGGDGDDVFTIHNGGNIDMSGYLKAKPSPGNGNNQLAKGRNYTWNQSNLSPDTSAGLESGWYPIMDISDGQYLFLIGTNAHNSATCLVTNGYDPSAVSRINVLNCVRNNNSQYLNINQIRVLNNGVVEVYLHASTPTYFGMYIQMISNHDLPNFYTTLTKNTGSPTVDDGKDFYTYSNSVGSGLMHVENLRIDGTLSKSSGSFTIPHPLPSKKDTHHLNHSFIEGPQCDNIYRGKVTLSSGAATVNLDTVSNMTEGTFVLLNRDVQCFTTNETGWGAIKGSVSGNILTISAQDGSSTDTISWMVVGERQDDSIKASNLTDGSGNLIVERELDSNVGLVTGTTPPYD